MNTQEKSTTTPKVEHTLSSILRVLLVDSLIILVILVLLEITLQIWYPYYSHQMYDFEYTGSFPIEMNKQGHRGSTVPLVKPQGELRILALGDSVTWGAGVRAEDTWPAQLKEKLHNQLGKPVSVINAAVPGASVDALTKSYQNVWKQYDVDVVIFVPTPNMVTRQWIDADAQLPTGKWNVNTSNWSTAAKLRLTANRIIHRFCLPSFLSINTKHLMYQIGLLTHKMDSKKPYGPMLAYGMAQPDIPSDSSIQAWIQFDEAVKHMQKVLNQDQVRLIYGFIEPRFAIWNTNRDNEKNVPRDRFLIDVHQQFVHLGETQNLESVDLVAALRLTRKTATDSPDLFILFDYNHLDPRGHKAIAQRLATRFSIDP